MLEWFYTLSLGLMYVFAALLILVVAKMAKGLAVPYNVDEQLTKHDNPAVGLALTGYFAGVFIIFLGAASGPELGDGAAFMDHVLDLGVTALYALAGIGALNIGRIVVDKMVLYKFRLNDEIVGDGNVGAGAVEFGAYVATALCISGAISGEGGGPHTAAAFFALGQLLLVLFGLFYQWVTKYDIHAEIERDNVAAGVAFGGAMIAIGVVMMRATGGDFVDWGDNLRQFGYFAIVGFVTLMAMHRLTDLFLMPGATIHEEIAKDKNINAAWVESVVSIGMGAVIYFML